MAKALDLVGKRFGYLTVISRTENNKNGNTQWLCKCDCGKTKVALGYDLTHGRTTTCGCAMYLKGKPSQNRVDLLGRRFGHLTVISLSEKRGKLGALYYDCKCDCGKTVSIQAGNLKTRQYISHRGCPLKDATTLKDLTGERFGRLTVIRRTGKDERGVLWECLCDCGNTKIVVGKNLRSGRTQSCGCLLNETRKLPKVKTHGLTRTRIYREYGSMISRCRPTYHMHSRYYDRGITVCNEWTGEGAFERFYSWAMQNGYSDDLTLDRIDNDKGYSPNNCRWVSNKEQQNNRGDNVYITINGATKTMKQWSEAFGVDYGKVKARRQNGWPDSRLFEP